MNGRLPIRRFEGCRLKFSNFLLNSHIVTRHLHIILLGFALGLFACQSSHDTQEAPVEEINRFQDSILVKIYNYQDQRNAEALLAYFKSELPIYRQAAALGLASVQDSTALDALIKLLYDAKPQVRGTAAYAIGQIGKDRASSELHKYIKREVALSARMFGLEALGKCANQEDLDFLIDLNLEEDSLQLGQARGILRAGLKGLRTEKGTAKMIALLESPLAQVREVAAYHLGRFKGAELVEFQEKLLEIFQKASNPFVRAQLASAFGALKIDSLQTTLIDFFENEENPLVQVNLLRAMPDQPRDTLVAFLKKNCIRENPQVAYTAASLLQTILRSDSSVKFGYLGKPNKSVNEALCATIELKDFAEFQREFDLTKRAYARAELLAAIQPLENYSFLIALMDTAGQAVIRTKAIEILVQLRDSFKELEPGENSAMEKDLAQAFQRAIESGDIGLVYQAALALRNPEFGYKDYYENADFLKESLAKLKLPKDIEAYQELQKTIDYFQGREPSQDFPKSTQPPIDWELVRQIPANQKVVLHTSEGDITWQLLVNDAPGSVSTFVKLVKEGFYDGKYFHRVVPNFVAQGGCPRGDGFGGLDYTIRSEFAPLYYQAGSVGLASAGKDTESCQFFITHSPTVHLDGSYTIFARVIKGMEIVNRLQIGAQIQSIELL